MKIPEEVLKTVGFVAYESKTSSDIVPVGTFFFLGHDPNEGTTVSSKTYAVTARHVVDALRRKGRDDLTLRLNSNIDTAQVIPIKTMLDDWYTHPTDPSVDVAIKEMGIPPNADHLVIPFSMCANSKIIAEHEVTLGDEVFISGLFRHHFGKRRNIPIVRTGNLAAMREETVATKHFGEMDAILVEARSIGGLSGSPVFLNLGAVRQVGGQVKHTTGKSPIVFLLGLIHGHFDSPGSEIDASTDDRSTVTEKVNAGIAIVVPIEKAIEVIQHYERR